MMFDEMKPQKRPKRVRTPRVQQFDLLEVTESLGYQTHRKVGGRNCWTKEEDEELKQAINTALQKINYANGIADITSIRESMEIVKKIPWEVLSKQHKSGARSAKEIKKRWTGSLDPNLKRGRWTAEEDDLLVKCYEKYGAKWSLISSEIAGRTDDQCAKRYIEVLGPGSKGRLRDWSLEEDLALIHKVKYYGTKWRKISSEMEFRPSLTCRNRWRKLVTLVVRDQAREEIARAIKEDKDISLSGALEIVAGASNNQGNQLSQMPQTSGELGGSMRTISANQITEKSTSEVPSSVTTVAHNVTNVESTRRDVSDVSSQVSTDDGSSLLPTGKQPRNMASHDTVSSGRAAETLSPNASQLATNLTPGIKNSEKEGMEANSLGKLQSKINELTDATSSDRNHVIQVGQAKAKRQNEEEKQPHGPVVPDSQSVKWNFSLENLSGISVMERAISNKEMVEEIIKLANDHSLNIVIHKHIHNHYGVHPTVLKPGNDGPSSPAHSYHSDPPFESRSGRMLQEGWSPSSTPANLTKLWDNNSGNITNSGNFNPHATRTYNPLSTASKHSGTGEQAFQTTGTEGSGGVNNERTTFDRESVRIAVSQMGIPSNSTVHNTGNTVIHREPSQLIDALRSKVSSTSSSESNIPSLLNENVVDTRNVSGTHLLDAFIRNEARLLRLDGQTPVSQIGSYSESSRDVTPISAQDKDNLLDMNALFLSKKLREIRSDNLQPPGVGFSKRSCNMPDVEPYRVPHFRYLPAALKPQLKSSPNLSNILNPPSSLNSHTAPANVSREAQ